MVELAYHPKKRKKETSKPLRRLDVDAVIKPVLDALTGDVWLDDYQVVGVSSELGEPLPEGVVFVTLWRRGRG